MRTKQTPTCGHPDKKHAAGGLCVACYKRNKSTPESRAKACAYAARKYAENPAKYRAKQAIWAAANPEKVGQWARDNPEKAKASQDAWRAENPDYARKHHLKKKYGMPLAEYEILNEKQKGLCASCGGKCCVRDNLSVDHCHITHNVRGLLCHSCNVSVGFCKNDPKILRKLAAYLEAYAKASSVLEHLATHTKSG